MLEVYSPHVPLASIRPTISSAVAQIIVFRAVVVDGNKLPVASRVQLFTWLAPLPCNVRYDRLPLY